MFSYSLVLKNFPLGTDSDRNLYPVEKKLVDSKIAFLRHFHVPSEIRADTPVTRHRVKPVVQAQYHSSSVRRAALQFTTFFILYSSSLKENCLNSL